MLEVFSGSALIILIYMLLLWAVAQALRDNGLADVGWGIGFTVVSWWVYATCPGERLLFLAVLVSIWGLRLALYIGLRNLKKKAEDWRYKEWRESWGRWAVIRALLQVFLLQGFFMWLIAWPVLMAGAMDPPAAVHPWFSAVGISLFLFGFIWETISDAQLARFKARPENRGKIMQSGLWRYSRHPNYFGEMVLWWGIYFCAQPLPFWWVAILGPLTISWLLTRVSGVPMLEQKYKEDPRYQEYSRSTPAFFPSWKRLFDKDSTRIK